VHPLARLAKGWLDRRKARGWLGGAPSPALRFLDVGCGDGRYLKMLHEWGVPQSQIWGTEIDGGVVDRLSSEGFQARRGGLEDAEGLPAGGFDLIVMLQVLEHVGDPAAAVRRAYELLAPGGAFVVETPNTDSLDCRLFREKYWGGWHIPRHWNLFDPHTLGRLLGEAGFRVERVRYLPAQTFWLYSFQHVVKYKWGMRGVAAWLNPLRNVPLLVLATGFDVARAALGFKTSNMQVLARKPS
jgi:SAM-dependent methyltransferase